MIRREAQIMFRQDADMMHIYGTEMLHKANY